MPLGIYLPVGLQAVEWGVGIAPESAEASHVVAWEPDIVNRLSAVEPVASVLLQPVTAEGEQLPLGLLVLQALNRNKEKL